MNSSSFGLQSSFRLSVFAVNTRRDESWWDLFLKKKCCLAVLYIKCHLTSPFEVVTLIKMEVRLQEFIGKKKLFLGSSLFDPMTWKYILFWIISLPNDHHSKVTCPRAQQKKMSFPIIYSCALKFNFHCTECWRVFVSCSDLGQFL